MSGEIISAREAKGLLTPAASLNELTAHFEQFQAIKKAILNKADVQDIAGKTFIKRSGWRKIATAFNISDEILHKEFDKDAKVWRVEVRAIAPNGRYAIGIGACSISEVERKKSAHPEHDAEATAHTRAKNRAISDLCGSGEVSAEEIEGNNPQVASEIQRAFGAERIKAADKPLYSDSRGGKA